MSIGGLVPRRTGYPAVLGESQKPATAFGAASPSCPDGCRGGVENQEIAARLRVSRPIVQTTMAPTNTRG